MKPARKSPHFEGGIGAIPADATCDCMNCRLKRMEAAIGSMQSSVLKLLDERQAPPAIPGMPSERNRMRRK